MDVEAKLKADGATALKSLEGAFRICNKSIGDRCVCAFVCVCTKRSFFGSIGDRKFGRHVLKKDGSPIEDLGGLERRYEALLIRHRAAILKALADADPGTKP